MPVALYLWCACSVICLCARVLFVSIRPVGQCNSVSCCGEWRVGQCNSVSCCGKWRVWVSATASLEVSCSGEWQCRCRLGGGGLLSSALMTAPFPWWHRPCTRRMILCPVGTPKSPALATTAVTRRCSSPPCPDCSPLAPGSLFMQRAPITVW